MAQGTKNGIPADTALSTVARGETYRWRPENDGEVEFAIWQDPNTGNVSFQIPESSICLHGPFTPEDLHGVITEFCDIVNSGGSDFLSLFRYVHRVRRDPHSRPVLQEDPCTTPRG